jgi:MFS family permease
VIFITIGVKENHADLKFVMCSLLSISGSEKMSVNPKTEDRRARLTPYLIGLMALLWIATFCEGYDFFVLSLVLTPISKEYGIGMKTVLYIVSAINLGMIAGFFIIRMGDRVGRKPILIIGVAGYGLMSLLTAAAPNAYVFLIAQAFSKMFLATEFGLAIVMIIEEFPPSIRATCVALLEVAGGLGGGVAMIVGSKIVEIHGWRMMYWIGGAPLAVVPLLFILVRETGHFQRVRAGIEEKPPSIWQIWAVPARKYVPIVGAIWFLGYLGYAGIVYHWVVFAETERAWSLAKVGPVMMIASLIGMTGYIAAGILMDVIGRRLTGVVFFLFGAVSLVWAFTSHGIWMIPSVIAAMFFIFAILPITSTYNAELFPTEMRTNATAWCNSLMGRPAQIVAPFLVGALKDSFGGIGNAVAILAVGPFIAAIIIWLRLPETKGVDIDRLNV